jgi:hypothetical protein
VQKANCLSTYIPLVTRSYLKNRLCVLYGTVQYSMIPVRLTALRPQTGFSIVIQKEGMYADRGAPCPVELDHRPRPPHRVRVCGRDYTPPVA